MRFEAVRAMMLPIVAATAAFVVSAGPVHADDPITCPVDGVNSYEDSFGWARSGGRRHQGIDMAADRGTPVVAAHDGDIRFKSSRLGGKSAWLVTVDGDRFFYAHLDAWEGESRGVRAGEVIGFVGSTGNAGGPHLHFETEIAGSTVNPYPALIDACSVDPAPFVPGSAASAQANTLQRF